MISSLSALVAASWVALVAGQAPDLSDDKPTACSGSAMVFDRARDRLVLFDGGGGRTCATARRVTWEHDGASWTKVAVDEGPSPRFFHAMVYDERRQVTVLFGGFCRESADICADAWEWDGTTWTPINVDGPGPRAAVVLTYDRDRERVLLFGGRDDRGPFRDLWSWDGDVWTRVWTGQVSP